MKLNLTAEQAQRLGELLDDQGPNLVGELDVLRKSIKRQAADAVAGGFLNADELTAAVLALHDWTQDRATRQEPIENTAGGTIWNVVRLAVLPKLEALLKRQALREGKDVIMIRRNQRLPIGATLSGILPDGGQNGTQIQTSDSSKKATGR